MDAPPILHPGTVFHGLRIHGELARGGMGCAYLASHGVLKRPLVLKTFRPVGDDLFREAHLAARVSSPHVVGVLDAGVHEDVPFLVQRYVDGLDLEELQTRFASDGLPTPVVVRLLADVARGLAASHRAGVVHRDIKPANLFLSGDARALIGDFGIALDPYDPKDVEHPTAGTPPFLAPELWQGLPPSPASDFYALGATAHLLATGRAPFAGSSALQLFAAHATQPYVPPATDDPATAYLYTLIAGLLAKTAEGRPPHAEALVRALARIEEPLPRWQAAPRPSVGGLEVNLCAGDLASVEADVLVNAANTSLVMDVGVAAALRRRAGDEVEREAVSQGPKGMGQVVWTGAGSLRATHVAHAVAAMDDAVCIQRAVLRSLLGARERQARTVAFPALGTGVGGVPHALSAKLTLEAIGTFAWLGRGTVERIDLVLFDASAHDTWQQVLAGM